MHKASQGHRRRPLCKSWVASVSYLRGDYLDADLNTKWGTARKAREWAREGSRKSHSRHSTLPPRQMPRHMVSTVHTQAGQQNQCHWNITICTEKHWGDRTDGLAGTRSTRARSHLRKPQIYSAGPQVSVVSLRAAYKTNSSSG